ncbi:MAG: divalent metal ion transporter [candidate division Zixibacteria bacterium RBG_16_53_22]|nr:MAG: divalent metal ion transporter [candidate division Zixibacteria bacterium RBG_16_53_22]
MVKRFNCPDRKLVECDDDQSQFVAYINPTEAEKRYLVEALKLDEHTLASALDPDELSRLEFEPEHVAIIFKRPRNYSAKDQFLFKVSSIGVFLFKDKLVLVTAEDVPLFNSMTFNRPPKPAFVMLRMIYRSIFHFLEHLKIISQISDELQTKINTAMENRQLINLFTLEKSLEYYLNSINSNGALIEKLRTNSTKIGFDTEEQELLDDIYIENNQCFKQAEIYSNILASLMDARASIVSNNLNVLLKTLNIITICIMVPTLVVSIFSMNVKIPLAEQPTAFWTIMLMALLSVTLVIFVWRYRRW